MRTASWLCVCLGLLFSLYGCGDDGGGTAVSTSVSGVVERGEQGGETASLKDAAIGTELTTPATENGGFTFDVTGRQPPFILKAGSLFSLGAQPGRANINSLSTLLVAEAGGFATPSAMEAFYQAPDATQRQNILTRMSNARQIMHEKLGPLLDAYQVSQRDPITDEIIPNQGFGLLLSDNRTTFGTDGAVVMTNRNGQTVFTAQLGNMRDGTLNAANILAPSIGTGTGPTVITGPTSIGPTTIVPTTTEPTTTTTTVPITTTAGPTTVGPTTTIGGPATTIPTISGPTTLDQTTPTVSTTIGPTTTTTTPTIQIGPTTTTIGPATTLGPTTTTQTTIGPATATGPTVAPTTAVPTTTTTAGGAGPVTFTSTGTGTLGAGTGTTGTPGQIDQ